MAVSSAVVPLIVGLILGGALAGIPLDPAGDVTGGHGAVLTGYGVGLGISLLALCLLHGATYRAWWWRAREPPPT